MLLDLVKLNRSYRGYDESRKITREEPLSFVECARLSPSSVNWQPLKYGLIWETDKVNEMLPCTGWARNLRETGIFPPRPGKAPTAYIVICHDKSIVEDHMRSKTDVGIVARTMLLAATEIGLGGCMIGTYNAGEVKRILALPENIVPSLVVAFGKPGEEIVLTEVGEDGKTTYYRDENDVHYVPKRALGDIIIE